MKKGDQIYNWMYEHIKAGRWINDFHNNYVFLEFMDKFYPNVSLQKGKPRFNYYAGKLVKNGICRKSTGYLSGRDFHNFGCRTINNYIPLDKSK